MIQYPNHEPIIVLYEDNHLLAVDKPAGLLSQADSSGEPDLLSLSKLYLAEKYQKKGNVFLGLVHRLDRPVSGVMLMARTSKSASRLSEQIRIHKWKKIYRAYCEGKTKEEDHLNHYLLKDHESNTSKVVKEGVPGSKKASLYYRRISYAHDRSLLEIHLETGRAHQIRVQLASIGHPIINDHKYGNGSKKKNIALKAHSLTIVHPTKKDELTISTSHPLQIPW